MRIGEEYRVVEVQQNPTIDGMQSKFIVLEQIRTPKPKKKRDFWEVLYKALLILSIICTLISFFLLGVSCYKALAENPEITAVESATEDVASADETVTESETDFFIESVPLGYAEQEALFRASEEFKVDYFVMLGLVEQETDFRNISGDSGNAAGYCQIWRKWWSGKMQDIGASDLNVPNDNFRTACAIMRELTDRHGSIAGALTAYNKGSFNGRVSDYATSVLENAEKWRNVI